MLKAVLVVLTLAPDGSTHLSLSDAADAADCARRRAAVEQVLAGAGTSVLAAGCGMSDQAFSPYDRQATDADYIHRWRVQMTEGGAVIQPLKPGADCAERRDAMQPSFCAVSAQSAR